MGSEDLRNPNNFTKKVKAAVGPGWSLSSSADLQRDVINVVTEFRVQRFRVGPGWSLSNSADLQRFDGIHS